MDLFAGQPFNIAQGHGHVFVGERSVANLAKHVGTQTAVDDARAALAAQVGCRIQWLEQVHGVDVFDVDTQGYSAKLDPFADPKADAAITAEPNLAIAILTADCLPVMFADLRGQYVAAAHAGWRGLGNGIIENTLQAFLSKGVRSQDIRVFLGPCIGPKMFEVGAEVRDVFLDLAQASEKSLVNDAFRLRADSNVIASNVIASNVRANQRITKWLANLPLLASIRLRRFDVALEHESLSQSHSFCTYSNPRKYFSYRHFCHHPETVDGRQVTLIWKRPV
jgi:polyphenol oxidase